MKLYQQQQSLLNLERLYNIKPNLPQLSDSWQSHTATGLVAMGPHVVQGAEAQHEQLAAVAVLVVAGVGGCWAGARAQAAGGGATLQQPLLYESS